MNHVQRTLIDLLALAINGDKLSVPALSVDEWHFLLKEAKEHGVHLLLTYSLKKQDTVFGDERLTKSSIDLLLVTMLYHASSVSIIEEFLDKTEKKGIEIMVLKGYYFQSLYPYPALRVMGDVDFYVKHEDLGQVGKILYDLGYKKFKDSHYDLHHMYIHPKFIPIEIHYSIMTKIFDENQRVFEDRIWDERVIRKIKSRPCIVPSEVNHAIYCCLHMMNHLRSSGFGLRQLCDLMILIKHDSTFEWNEFMEKARTFRVFNFVSSILWICHIYFDFKIPDIYLTSIKPRNIDNVRMLMESILRSGEFGRKDKIYTISKTLAEYQLNKSFIKVNNPLSFIFPNKQKLSEVYKYAKNHLILLPIAWIHRIIFNLTRTDLRLIEKLPNNDVMRQHKELIKWLSQE